ncbi:MAG: chemotaxis protein CheW [Enterobacterales bacterium]|nr:chemotaxis protein CheW [Enterobacterales bacterium]
MAKVAIEIEDDGHVQENATQYVTFQVGDEHFAFSMEQVAEIVRVPLTVSVPLTPPALVGLANLRGNVLPVLDLRRLLQLESLESDDATRVLVADVGQPVGLIVDRVSRVLNVENSQVEKADAVQTTTDAKLLKGVIKQGDSLIQILAVKQLIEKDFATILKSAAENQSVTATMLDLASTSKDQDENEEDAGLLVNFSVDNQEYAFDLMDVEEIVRVPQNIAKIPNTEAHVLGLINLRGRLLPLVSLRSLFDFEEQAIEERNRILVISLRGIGGAKTVVGLVVDEMREVLSVPKNDREDVPALLKSEQGDEITAVCRLDGGKRLISILSSTALFNHPSIQVAMASSKQEVEQVTDKLDNKQDQEDEDDTQMVVFKLADQEYGITIDHVQEITRIPDEMSKVPKTADFIEGMVNLRGKVMPVLDMRTRFGLEKSEPNEGQRILVLNIKGNQTGFIMDSVVEVLRLNSNSIEDAPDLSDDQTRMMGRVVNLREEKRMIQVLDVQELLSKKEQKALHKKPENID